MKKSLLALAVLGAFAGVASAQTNVTLYGVADVGFESFDNGDARTNGLESGGQSASRVGLKGTEDLGNGLKAMFMLENGFDLDTGNGTGNRYSYVGLGGEFGAVTLGRQNTPLKDAYSKIDPFGAAGTIGNIENVFFGGTAGNNRVANTVKFATPSYSGFNGGVSYTFGEVEDSNSSNRQLGLNLGYGNGPIDVQFGFADLKGNTAAIPAVGDDARRYFLGAAYDFGAAKLHAAYGDAKNEPVGGGTNVKNRSGMVGVSVPFGASALMASYTLNQNRTIDDADTQHLALMYTYDMSKRTNLYAGYGYTRNDGAVNLRTRGGDVGDDPKVLAVGVRHKF